MSDYRREIEWLQAKVAQYERDLANFEYALWWCRKDLAEIQRQIEELIEKGGEG